MSNQPELPLEYASYDHYTIELRKGPLYEETTVRSHEAKTVADAENFVEALRDTANQRDGVSWQFEEVNPEGKLYGLAPGGVVYQISVTPPLSTPLA
jgi:hypothetical protein